MNATETLLPIFAKLPKAYEALCHLHLPRTLHDGIEHDAVTEIIDLMADHTLNPDQAEYLETLAELSAAYESTTDDSPPPPPPHESLAVHLQNVGMTATQWDKCIGIDRSTASRLLSGERKFNTTHISKTPEAHNLAAKHLI